MNELKLCDETFWACFLDWWKEDFEWFSSQKESIVDLKFLIRKLEKKREIEKREWFQSLWAWYLIEWKTIYESFNSFWNQKLWNSTIISCLFFIFFGMNSFFWIEIFTVCYLIECEIPRKVSIQLNEIFEKIFSIHFFSNSKFF